MTQPRATSAGGTGVTVDRRSAGRGAYSRAQLLGRAPIRLRRRGDRLRLTLHLAFALGLLGLSVWWVIPFHPFAGPVLFVVAPGTGVHLGDLPTLGFVALAARLVVGGARLLRRSD